MGKYDAIAGGFTLFGVVALWAAAGLPWIVLVTAAGLVLVGAVAGCFVGVGLYLAFYDRKRDRDAIDNTGGAKA